MHRNSNIKSHLQVSVSSNIYWPKNLLYCGIINIWFKMWLSTIWFNFYVFMFWFILFGKGGEVFIIRTSVTGFCVCVCVCVRACVRARARACAHSKLTILCVITRFRRDFNQIFVLVDITHRRWVVTAFWSPWLLKLELIGCPETSVTNYQSTLHNISEERRFRPSCLIIRFQMTLKRMFCYRMNFLNLFHCILKNIPGYIASECAPITSCCFRSRWQALITSATHWCITFCIATWQVHWIIMNICQMDDCQNISILKTGFGIIFQQTVVLISLYFYIIFSCVMRSSFSGNLL